MEASPVFLGGPKAQQLTSRLTGDHPTSVLHNPERLERTLRMSQDVLHTLTCTDNAGTAKTCKAYTHTRAHTHIHSVNTYHFIQHFSHDLMCSLAVHHDSCGIHMCQRPTRNQVKQGMAIAVPLGKITDKSTCVEPVKMNTCPDGTLHRV